MSYAVLIHADGLVECIDFPGPDDDGQYQAMSDAVGGYIEHVNVICNDVPLDMWVNEEGLLRRFPYNSVASYIYQQSVKGGEVLIVGDALITSGDDEGNTLGLTDEQVQQVLIEIQVYAETHGLGIVEEPR